jgi:hypothetical protein
MPIVQEKTALAVTLNTNQTHTSEKRITLAVCLQQTNSFHALYIKRLVQTCATHNITCSIIPLSTTSTEHIVSILEHQPLTAILCIDNTFAPAILVARAKLHSSAPLIFCDAAIPASIPHPLPPKCMTISTSIPHFIGEMCHLITHLPSVNTIMILYDEHDPLFSLLAPDFYTLLVARNYKVHLAIRKATITRHDVIDYAAYNLILLLSRRAPEEYLQRLALVCKEQHILLYAAHAHALAHGAVFGFTPSISALIQETVNALLKYTVTGTMPSSVVVPFECGINTYELASHPQAAQDLESLLTFARNVTILHPTTADKVAAYLQLELIPLE